MSTPRIVDPDSVRVSEDTPDEAAIRQILKEGLSSEADSATKAADLAERLRDYIFNTADGSPKRARDLVWDLWLILVEVVTAISLDDSPHDHDVLVTTIHKLRREGGSIVDHKDSDQWAELPGLSMYLRDKWASPSDCGEYTPDDVDGWKRLNSFASRLLADDFRHWIPFAWWGITADLETAPQDSTEVEWRLWVVTEWLIQCGNLLFKDLSSSEELHADVLASIRPGPLCAEVHPMSIQRWEFWLSRLTELRSGIYKLSDGSEVAVLSDLSISRIDQAITAMRSHESNSIPQGESQGEERCQGEDGNEQSSPISWPWLDGRCKISQVLYFAFRFIYRWNGYA